MKYQKVWATSLILIVFFCTLYDFGIFYAPTAQAAETTREISFSYNRDDTYEYGGVLYASVQYMKTNTITINEVPGKKIKSAKLQKGTANVKEITAAAGQASWVGQDTVYGSKLAVTSKNNESPNGGWYSWDRYGLGSQGNGMVWYADSIPKSCSGGTPDAAKNNVPKWPGCSSDELVTSFPRVNNYYTSDNQFVPSYVASYDEKDTDHIVVVDTDRKNLNMPILLELGQTDPSTKVLGYKALDANTIQISYEQTFNNDDYKIEWAARWAQMNVYFAAFKVDFISVTYTYPTKLVVIYEDEEDKDDPDPPSIDGACTWTIGAPTGGTTRTATNMTPNATGTIAAANSVFNVSTGIPTSEYTNANVLSLNYLFQNNFQQMSGKIKYDCTVDVTYSLDWTESVACTPIPAQHDPITGEETLPADCTYNPPKNKYDTSEKTYKFSFEKDYSYWTIKNFEAYFIDRAVINNYLLPSGKITLSPDNYTFPSAQTQVSTVVANHVKPASTGSFSLTSTELSLTGSLDSKPTVPNHTSILLSRAQAVTQDAQVKNDKLVFNGSTIMSDSWATKAGAAPSAIPTASRTGTNVLNKTNMLVSSSLTNRANNASTGTIYYNLLPGNVGGGSDKTFAISGLPNATVHTPVVLYADSSNDTSYDQRTQASITSAAGRNALILDRQFSVNLPNNGVHDVYGNGTYTKYIKTKQVHFPFDVIMNGSYVAAKTWISMSASTTTAYFELPIWVSEGNYTVMMRTIAQNAPSDYEADVNKNSISAHAAFDTVSVAVVGRLYDFQITDVSDPLWDSVERTYYIGNKKLDGASRGIASTLLLPLRAGSHPTYKNTVPKHGYNIKFNLKTTGNMDGTSDAIKITPTFYYVPKNGTGTINTHATPVDIYYHSGSEKYIKVGDARDKATLTVVLDSKERNIPKADITNTAGFYTTKYPDYLASTKKATKIGKYSWMILPKQTRTLIGLTTPVSTINVPPSATTAQRSNSLSGIQQWYGQFNLPNEVFVVPKGTNIVSGNKVNTPSFLKNGYILVNFHIETLVNGDKTTGINTTVGHLGYYGTPRANQWNLEGFTATKTDGVGRTYRFYNGDVALFDLDNSSTGDIGAGGTH